jgi:eukaryotic-like serine/threonine-protein kinase
MMKQRCPSGRLPLLIQDQLSPEESDRILDHLEECTTCQNLLDTLSADSTWWDRAKRGLSDVPVDESGRLPDAPASECDVDALLEADPTLTRSDMPHAHDSAMMLDPPTRPDDLGVIDEFDIEEKIGQGGMGIVFRGYDRTLNRKVAIKVMAPHLGANEAARKRFSREAQAAATIVHPHVVPIYRISSSPDRPYMAMAFVEGCSLQDFVSRDGPLDKAEIIRIAIQATEGLRAAHRQGLIHRDVKPANILLNQDTGQVMITDFGLARAADDLAMTQSGLLAGTPNYMSPEQIQGGGIDHRSDLFSLGGVIYFLATGLEPFNEEHAFAVINKIMREASPSARSVNDNVSEILDRIIGRLLEKDPSDRYNSADELLEVLMEYSAHLKDPIQCEAPRVKRTPSERKARGKRIRWMLASLGFLAVLCWGGYMLTQTSTEGRGIGDPEAVHGGEEEHHDEE